MKSFHFKTVSFTIDIDVIQAQFDTSLQETVTSVNLEREKKSIPVFDNDFFITCYKI